MKKSIYALLFIHIIVFIISCNKSNDPDIASGLEISDQSVNSVCDYDLNDMKSTVKLNSYPTPNC